MKIVFRGIEKDFGSIPSHYLHSFVKYHLEIPWYYAEEGGNQVVITTGHFHYSDPFFKQFPNGGSIRLMSDVQFSIANTLLECDTPDVVIQWRKWNDRYYDPKTLNLLHTCDHTYPDEWKRSVASAFDSGKLYGILCYRTWHKNAIAMESGLPMDRLFTDTTLGVDPSIYEPAENKDPYKMLWSSDPGRGLNDALALAVKLHLMDKRFRLHVCWPDYVRPPKQFQHPAIVWEGNVPNGHRLWDLFNTSGILPYTSCFKEPSSRAHRQAQAAGSLVLYPPDMGSPSELIQNEVTGIVAPIASWPARIIDLVRTGAWRTLGINARNFAVSQSWAVQAKNFNVLIGKIREEQQ